MSQGNISIVNKLGLHARSASKLVSLASSFSSDIELIYKDKCVDAKSIMNLLMLAAKQGEEITVVSKGEDEQEALEAICELIADGFGEES
jgi:phosphocarrier protein